jgi:hypothetical protein
MVRARPTCIGANKNINHSQTRRFFVARNPDGDVGELPRESVAFHLLISQALEPIDETSILEDDRGYTEVGVASFAVEPGTKVSASDQSSNHVPTDHPVIGVVTEHAPQIGQRDVADVVGD